MKLILLTEACHLERR